MECKQCRFWEPSHSHSRDIAMDGECRRRSPVIVITYCDTKSWFPQTPPHGWCGDFEKCQDEVGESITA